MPPRLSGFKLRLLLIGLTCLAVVVANGSKAEPPAVFDLKCGDTVEIAASPASGFDFPYYLFVPDAIDKNEEAYLLVEPNNTGTTSDDFEVHRQKALSLANDYPRLLATELHVPLLVPVFPRPQTGWQTYTHSLDRDTVEINDGPLKRLDLQLAAMIDHATGRLRANGFKIKDQVFMDGFSASAKFCIRFAFLHPERVKALAAGGVNALPTLPLVSRNGQVVPFPIGVADIERFTGRTYDAKAHQAVAQYIYMGYLDRNDTLPSRDAWSEGEANIIKAAIAERMMPDRWAIVQSIYRDTLPRAQCVTYNGVGHAIKPEMLRDIERFFTANSGNDFVAIDPHDYPFVEYAELRQMHITAVYTGQDKRLPKFLANKVKEGTFLFVVQEWIPGLDHTQLTDFVANAGFNFRLVAAGHPEIALTRENWCGNTSSGDGKFQAHYMEFEKDQLEKMSYEVPYTLVADNLNDQYVWVVADGVTLTKPIPADKTVQTELDHTGVSNMK